MFFFGSGSAILPYLFYLLLIWGVFLVNGLAHQSVKYQKNRKIASENILEDSFIIAKDNVCYYSDNLKNQKDSNTTHLQNDYFEITLIPFPLNVFCVSGGDRRCLQGCISFRAPPA
ncbi:MAG: hypothetical protein JXB00_19720 [Bacteroidales bacterium]|nr:hypothetical protein [Bacteroidales bacterium]